MRWTKPLDERAKLRELEERATWLRAAAAHRAMGRTDRADIAERLAYAQPVVSEPLTYTTHRI